MFTTLKKNIIRSIMLSTVLLSIGASLASFIVIAHSQYNHYKNAANDTIDQKITLSSFAFNNVMLSSRQLSENEAFLEAIDSDEFNPQIVPVLNTLKNSSFGILAATVYVVEGPTYSTFNVTNVVPYTQWLEYDPVNNLLMSESSSMLSIRTTHIAQIYNNVRYNDAFGMITYVVKLEREGNVVGLLFVDIAPTYVYQTYFNYDNHPRFQGTVSFMIGENRSHLLGSLAHQTHADYIDEALQNSNAVSSNGRYLMHAHTLHEEHQLITLIPMGPLYATLIRTGVLLLVLNVLIIAMSYFVAQWVERRIVTPLQRLNTRMQPSRHLLKRPE